LRARRKTCRFSGKNVRGGGIEACNARNIMENCVCQRTKMTALTVKYRLMRPVLEKNRPKQHCRRLIDFSKVSEYSMNCFNSDMFFTSTPLEFNRTRYS
jgi:hypothetical protein